jgi:hypothetical protein
MSSVSLRALPRRRGVKSVGSALAREPLVTRGLLVGLAITAIHLAGPRLGLSGQLSQDICTLVDPLVIIGMVLAARHHVTPLVDPHHRDGRPLVPAPEVSRS